MKKIIICLSLVITVLSCDKKKSDTTEKIATSTVDENQNPLEESIKRGKEVYVDMCITCHLPNGKGVPKIYPPLAESDFLMKKKEESIRAIKYGMQGEVVVNGVTYNQVMSPLGLGNDEVADVMNYISNSWGNKSDRMFTEKEVEKVSE